MESLNVNFVTVTVIIGTCIQMLAFDVNCLSTGTARLKRNSEYSSSSGVLKAEDIYAGGISVGSLRAKFVGADRIKAKYVRAKNIDVRRRRKRPETRDVVDIPPPLKPERQRLKQETRDLVPLPTPTLPPYVSTRSMITPENNYIDVVNTNSRDSNMADLLGVNDNNVNKKRDFRNEPSIRVSKARTIVDRYAEIPGTPQETPEMYIDDFPYLYGTRHRKTSRKTPKTKRKRRKYRKPEAPEFDTLVNGQSSLDQLQFPAQDLKDLPTIDSPFRIPTVDEMEKATKLKQLVPNMQFIGLSDDYIKSLKMERQEFIRHPNVKSKLVKYHN